MNEQPEALLLAERLVGMEASSNDQYEAAAELRRLHEENERLREAVGAEREACIRIIQEHQIPVGNSPAGEMACKWTHDALKEIRAAIRARGEA